MKHISCAKVPCSQLQTEGVAVCFAAFAVGSRLSEKFEEEEGGKRERQFMKTSLVFILALDLKVQVFFVFTRYYRYVCVHSMRHWWFARVCVADFGNPEPTQLFSIQSFLQLAGRITVVLTDHEFRLKGTHYDQWILVGMMLEIGWSPKNSCHLLTILALFLFPKRWFQKHPPNSAWGQVLTRMISGWHGACLSRR